MSAQQHVVRMAVVGLLVAGVTACIVSCQTQPQGSGDGTAAAPAGTEAALERGHQVYLAYCAMCHGVWGEGDGPLSAEMRQQSGVGPAHLNDRARLDELGRDEIVKVIKQGGAHTQRSNLMPSWGDRLDTGVINMVADFVMSLPDRKPGVPDATIEKYLAAPAGVPEDGRRLFVFYCTSCHGPYGRGDGVMADTLKARNGVGPRDLGDAAYFSKLTDQDLYVTLSLGGAHSGRSPFMPAWTTTLKPEEIKDLVSYVRAISNTPAQP